MAGQQRRGIVFVSDGKEEVVYHERPRGRDPSQAPAVAKRHSQEKIEKN